MHAIHAMQRHDAQPNAFPHGLADPASGWRKASTWAANVKGQMAGEMSSTKWVYLYVYIYIHIYICVCARMYVSKEYAFIFKIICWFSCLFVYF